MLSVLVVANGVVNSGGWLDSRLGEANFVVAVDGGANFLYEIDHKPDVYVGDQDSVGGSALEWLVRSGTEMAVFDADKDQTDLELALLRVSSLNPNQIIVLGGFGGRLDHTLANVMLLANPDLADAPILFVDETQTAQLVGERLELHGSVGDLVSLIPLSREVAGVTTSGLKWPLKDACLELGSTHGISNEFAERQAWVSGLSGHLLCVQTLQENIQEGT